MSDLGQESETSRIHNPDMFGFLSEFTNREQVYERACMSIADLSYTPFEKLSLGDQFKLNDYADTLLGLTESYRKRHGTESGYEYCASDAERVAYCLWLRFGARWERVERMAWFLHEASHYNRHRAAGLPPPLYPFMDNYREHSYDKRGTETQQ